MDRARANAEAFNLRLFKYTMIFFFARKHERNPAPRMKEGKYPSTGEVLGSLEEAEIEDSHNHFFASLRGGKSRRRQ